MKHFLLLLTLFLLSASANAQSRPSGDRGDMRQRIENVRSNDSGVADNSSNNSQSSQSKGVGKIGLTECGGEFAYCGASTCKPTGKMITVKEDGGKYTRKYPEAVCKCPVITKEIAIQNGTELHGFAALNEGNMNGSCRPPSKNTIWSYASMDIQMFPQESTSPPFQMEQVQLQTCPAGSGTGVNCWNFLCKLDAKPVNGVRTASCSCPIGESPMGHKASASDNFITSAGMYFNNPTDACSMYPVSLTEIEQ
jgi:hypothetical protein